MPHHAMTAAPFAESAMGSLRAGLPSAPGRHRHRFHAVAHVTHTMRATIIVRHTAAATPAYSAPVAPVARATIDLSWNPTRMNASTFSTNTATSHTAHDGMRMRAGITSEARRAAVIAKTTIVMMPERCSRCLLYTSDAADERSSV